MTDSFPLSNQPQTVSVPTDETKRVQNTAGDLVFYCYSASSPIGEHDGRLKAGETKTFDKTVYLISSGSSKILVFDKEDDKEYL